MSKRSGYFLLVLMLLGLCGIATYGQVPAFPGAQGAGADSVGGSGRNGTGTATVMEVTNLTDGGSGSLRACIEASGPRTCIFRVSGLIVNSTRLQIRNPYITIAGQTSPNGIVLQSAGAAQCTDTSGCGTPFISTHDVIIRYITYDGSAKTATGPDTGTNGFEMTSGNVFNVILDHLSCRWWGNACVDQFSNDGGTTKHNTTQWSMFYEPNKTHPIIIKFDATTGSALASVDYDFHHNFGANSDRRWPLSAIRSFRWVSNLLYNFGQDGDGDFYSLSWGGAQADYISNKYVDGPNTGTHAHAILANHDNGGSDASNNCASGSPCDNPGPPSFYIVNNISHKCTSAINSCTIGTIVASTHVVNDNTQILQTSQGWEGAEESKSGITLGAMPGTWFRSTPLPTETYPITADASETLDNVLIGTVGNSQGLACTGGSVARRDSADQRVLNQYQAKGAGTWFTGQYVTPAIANGTACTESLHDGIPDAYKSGNSISTSDTTYNRTVQANGYTGLENYLNQIGQANGAGAGTGSGGGTTGGGTTGGGTGGGGTTPTPVPDVTISAVGVTGITTSCATINWTTNNAADSQVGYGVCPTALTFTPCCSPSNVTNHTVQVCGLSPATTYNFVTQSFDGNTTATSPLATFQTLASSGGGNATQPTAPQLQPAVPITSFELTWPPSVSTGVTSYKVYRSNVTGKSYVQIGQLTGTAFVDTSVQHGQTWFYVITAIAPSDTVQESGFSNEISVVVP